MYTELTVNTALSVVDYSVLAEAIVNGFFDESGNYSPYFGKINAIAMFYNFCVTESEFDEEFNHHIDDLIYVDKLAANRDFMNEFNKAIKDTDEIKLNFGNAYNDALKIVDEKKNGVDRVIKFIKDLAVSVTKEMVNLKDMNISDLIMGNTNKSASTSEESVNMSDESADTPDESVKEKE